MNCSNCGRFMTKLGIMESELEPHTYQWWGCLCDIPDSPELIYDKTPKVKNDV